MDDIISHDQAVTNLTVIDCQWGTPQVHHAVQRTRSPSLEIQCSVSNSLSMK